MLEVVDWVHYNVQYKTTNLQLREAGHVDQRDRDREIPFNNYGTVRYGTGTGTGIVPYGLVNPYSTINAILFSIDF